MNRKAFTLTEILIVIVIAAVLVGLILPRAMRAIAHGNYLADQANLRSIDQAIMMCWTETKNFSLCSTGTQLAPKYMKAFPTSPCGNGGVYSTASDGQTTQGIIAVNSLPCPQF